VRYLQRAADTASRRSAYDAAEAHVRHALSLLDALDDDRQRARLELEL
jgi:predicted ATPase